MEIQSDRLAGHRVPLAGFTFKVVESMTPPLRRRHLVVWAALTLLVAAILLNAF